MELPFLVGSASVTQNSREAVLVVQRTRALVLKKHLMLFEHLLQQQIKTWSDPISSGFLPFLFQLPNRQIEGDALTQGNNMDIHIFRLKVSPEQHQIISIYNINIPKKKSNYITHYPGGDISSKHFIIEEPCGPPNSYNLTFMPMPCKEKNKTR